MSFTSLCGVSPVPASSGKTVRHRLNRGGDRAANSALHIIAIGTLRIDQRTKDYVARRIAEGHSKLDAIRALKRYLAREVFTLIRSVAERSTPFDPPLDKQKGVQGSQFTSADFTGVLIGAGVRISMDGRGRWMDNVFIERVWRSLKYEDIDLKGYADGREAKAGIGEYSPSTTSAASIRRSAIARRWPSGAKARPLDAYGHVDNADALTTCPQADQNSSRQNPWRLEKGQPADGLPT